MAASDYAKIVRERGAGVGPTVFLGKTTRPCCFYGESIGYAACAASGD